MQQPYHNIRTIIYLVSVIFRVAFIMSYFQDSIYNFSTNRYKMNTTEVSSSVGLADVSLINQIGFCYLQINIRQEH